MRFLFFNVIVGLALVYLFNGDKMPTGGFRESVSVKQESTGKAVGKMKRKLDVVNTQKSKTNTDAKAEPKTEPKAFTKDIIPVRKLAPAKREQSPPPPPPSAEPYEQLVQPLRLPKAQTITSRPVHTIDEAYAVNIPVLKHGDEVFASGPAPAPGAKFSLKEGTNLMSVDERRRQLDNLAEEMELLYFEKIGS